MATGPSGTGPNREAPDSGRGFYKDASLFSGRRGVIFALVVLAHIGVGYLFATSLGLRIIRVVIAPVIITQIDEPRARDNPAPTPLKLSQTDVYVP